jgi:hypothetical protein
MNISNWVIKSVYVSSMLEVFELGTEAQVNYFTGSYQVLTKQEDLSSSF